MRFALTIVAISGVAACETLPALQFYSDDAALDASTGDSGSGGAASDSSAFPDQSVATIPDALFDQGSPPLDASDSSTDAGSGTCPAAPPAGATTCCSAIPCSGANASKCLASCTNCENDCNVGQTCCLDKNGNFAGCSAIACP